MSVSRFDLELLCTLLGVNCDPFALVSSTLSYASLT